MQPSDRTVERDAESFLPPVPDDIRDAARQSPDHWIGMVDPGWSGQGPPPQWAVIGEWRSSPSGEVEDYRANDDYRPSPRMLDWPEPSDPVDAAVQLAVTGYGPLSEAVTALAAAEVTVLHAPDGEPLTAAGADDLPVVPVFTSPAQQPFEGGLAQEELAAAELARRLEGTGAALSVNPGAPARLVIPPEAVLNSPADAGAHPAGHNAVTDDDNAVTDEDAGDDSRQRGGTGEHGGSVFALQPHATERTP